MTSQNKYKRRQDKRKQKKQKFLQELGSYDEVFTYEHLYDAFFNCKQGVMWKSSIQTCQMRLPAITYMLYHDLTLRIYRSKGFTEFDIMERGKKRHIRSVHITERNVQRTLCDYYLAPIVGKYIIYDNGASMKHKGTSFAISRIQVHLQRYYRHYQTNEGYAFLYDFSDYFNSIDHDKLYEVLDKLLGDEDLKRLTHHFIDCFGEDGLGLGSQVSQMAAVLFGDKVDRLFKEKLHCKYYGRYMDDGYAFARTLEEAKLYKKCLQELAAELNLKINEKKIKIIKLSKYFTFLKKKFKLSETGKIYKKLTRKNIVTQRRKLKKLFAKMWEGKMEFSQIRSSYTSWRSNAVRYNNYWTVKHMDSLYNSLVFADWHIDIKGGLQYYGYSDC